jgi:hypothetical protein
MDRRPRIRESEHRIVAHDRWQVELNLAGPGERKKATYLLEVDVAALNPLVDRHGLDGCAQALVKLLASPINRDDEARDRLEVVAVDREAPEEVLLLVGR